MTCDIQICCPRAGQGAILTIASCRAKFKFGWAKNFARCFTRSIIEPETSTLEQCCTVLINMEDRESQPIVSKMLKQQQKHTKTIVSVKSSDVGLFHYESPCWSWHVMVHTAEAGGHLAGQPVEVQVCRWLSLSCCDFGISPSTGCDLSTCDWAWKQGKSITLEILGSTAVKSVPNIVCDISLYIIYISFDICMMALSPFKSWNLEPISAP